MGSKKKEALEQFNRDNILEAAAELFLSKGVEKTTMDDIASHADYSKSTIYVYFKSKEDIYNSVLAKRYTDLMFDIAGVELEKGDYWNGYYKLCNCLVEFEEQYPNYFLTLMGIGKSTNSRKDPGASGFDKDVCEIFEQFLEVGISRKLIKANIDVGKMAMYMWTTIGGAIQFASRRKEHIRTKLKISKEKYLKYCFESLAESLKG